MACFAIGFASYSRALFPPAVCTLSWFQIRCPSPCHCKPHSRSYSELIAHPSSIRCLPIASSLFLSSRSLANALCAGISWRVAWTPVFERSDVPRGWRRHMATMVHPEAQAKKDFLPLNGTDYVEFYVGNARQSAYY